MQNNYPNHYFVVLDKTNNTYIATANPKSNRPAIFEVPSKYLVMRTLVESNLKLENFEIIEVTPESNNQKHNIINSETGELIYEAP